MKPGIQPPPIPPALLAHVEALLARHNIDGKVPLDIACRILDDIYDLSLRQPGWSCATYERYGLHACCHRCHPPKEPA